MNAHRILLKIQNKMKKHLIWAGQRVAHFMLPIFAPIQNLNESTSFSIFFPYLKGKISYRNKSPGMILSAMAPNVGHKLTNMILGPLRLVFGAINFSENRRGQWRPTWGF